MLLFINILNYHTVDCLLKRIVAVSEEKEHNGLNLTLVKRQFIISTIVCIFIRDTTLTLYFSVLAEISTHSLLLVNAVVIYLGGFRHHNLWSTSPQPLHWPECTSCSCYLHT